MYHVVVVVANIVRVDVSMVGVRLYEGWGWGVLACTIGTWWCC